MMWLTISVFIALNFAITLYFRILINSFDTSVNSNYTSLFIRCLCTDVPPTDMQTVGEYTRAFEREQKKVGVISLLDLIVGNSLPIPLPVTH